MQINNFFVLSLTNVARYIPVIAVMNAKDLVFTVARYGAAIIMLQTLYFKFSGAAESVYIFTQVGIEPWGRIATGVLEVIASSFLLYKAYSWLGALLALGLMSGALFMHFTLLGIAVMGDGGYLFALAVVVLVCSLVVLVVQRKMAFEQLLQWKKVFIS
jgi:putative oxidoreductase